MLNLYVKFYAIKINIIRKIKEGHNQYDMLAISLKDIDTWLRSLITAALLMSLVLGAIRRTPELGGTGVVCPIAVRFLFSQLSETCRNVKAY